MTQMLIVFLGTGGGMPTRSRNLPAIAVRYSGSLILLDCGESTQRQILMAGLGFPEDTKIFLTHLHADHLLGLPGVIYTMAMLGREAPLNIFGPPGTEDVVNGLLSACGRFDSFDIIIKEVERGVVYSERDFTVEAIEAEHTTYSLCYKIRERDRPGKMNVEYLQSIALPRGPLWGRLQRGEAVFYNGRWIRPEEAVGPRRPGRVVVYTGDTRPNERIVAFCKDADVLIHDSTFDEGLASKARDDGHSTASEAAMVAKMASVKLLVLTHISPRYEGKEEILLNEARKIFPNVILPSDLDRLEVSYRV